MFNKNISINVDRDSVCAGDDSESHESRINISSSLDIYELVNTILEKYPLAKIEGDQATWVVDVGERTSIGVVAQQWSKPELVISPDISVKQLFADIPRNIYFRYMSQVDPHEVLESIRTKKAH